MSALRYLPLLALVLGAIAPERVAGQTAAPIHHCVDAQGNDVFTDGLCSSMKSTPVTAAAVASSRHDFSELPPTLCAGTDHALKQAVINAFASHDVNRLAGLILWGGDRHRAAVSEIRSLGRWVQQPLIDVNVIGNDASPAHLPNGSATAPGLSDAIGSTVSLASTRSGSIRTESANPELEHSQSEHPQLVIKIAGAEKSSGAQQILFGMIHRAGCVWLHNDD